MTAEEALSKLKAWRNLMTNFSHLGTLPVDSLKRHKMITEHAVWVNFKQYIEWKPGDKRFHFPVMMLRQPVSQWIKDQ